MAVLTHRIEALTWGKTPVAQGSGTKTADGTEQTLLDVAVAGLFGLIVDLAAMQATDITEFRIYQIVLTGGTRRVAYLSSYAGIQAADDLILEAPPISNELTDSGSLRFTLTQTEGTGRAYPWKVLSYI